MDKFKSFSDYATEHGATIEALDTSFLIDFGEYMQESVRQSDHNNMMAINTASKTVINR